MRGGSKKGGIYHKRGGDLDPAEFKRIVKEFADTRIAELNRCGRERDGLSVGEGEDQSIEDLSSKWAEVLKTWMISRFTGKTKRMDNSSLSKKAISIYYPDGTRSVQMGNRQIVKAPKAVMISQDVSGSMGSVEAIELVDVLKAFMDDSRIDPDKLIFYHVLWGQGDVSCYRLKSNRIAASIKKAARGTGGGTDIDTFFACFDMNLRRRIGLAASQDVEGKFDDSEDGYCKALDRKTGNQVHIPYLRGIMSNVNVTLVLTDGGVGGASVPFIQNLNTKVFNDCLFFLLPRSCSLGSVPASLKTWKKGRCLVMR